MLHIDKRSKKTGRLRFILGLSSLLLLGGGLYLLMLVLSPVAGPLIAMKPIDVKTLPLPKDNRIIIPKIGVNIMYDKGAASLDRGAEWRYPDRGNPATGGNFIIAAHRFTIQPTPQQTIEKSPFYNVDKLIVGDKIVVDYTGKRYGYEISTISHAAPTQVEIEQPSETAKLTLYTCELDGPQADRLVVVAKPLGLVALESDDSPTTN